MCTADFALYIFMGDLLKFTVEVVFFLSFADFRDFCFRPKLALSPKKVFA